MQLESQQIQNLYQGPHSSKEFNQQVQSLQKDVVTLFDALNKNEQSLTQNMDISLKEHHFFQKRLKELSLQIRALEEQVVSTREAGEDIHYQSFFDLSAIQISLDDLSAKLDASIGIATLATSHETSRLSYETETGQVLFPKGLSIFVRETNDIEVKDPETNQRLYKDLSTEGTFLMVDKQDKTYWTRDAIFPEKDCVSKVFGELHIKVPKEGLNGLHANLLTINPYPSGSLTIEDIYYRGYGDQWLRLPNFPTREEEGREVPIPMEKVEKTLFSFPKTEIAEIRILFSQPYWFENNNERVFSYGFKDVDLRYHLYSEKENSFVTTLQIKGGTGSFLRLDPPISLALEASEQDLTDLVRHELYYDASLSTPFAFGSDVLIPLSQVYIKTILKKEGDKVPVLKELHFPYTKRQMT